MGKGVYHVEENFSFFFHVKKCRNENAQPEEEGGGCASL